MKKYVLGIDVGGTTVKCGLLGIEGFLIEGFQVPTDKSDGGIRLFDNVAEAMDECLRRRGISRDEILGAGIGVPGPVVDDRTVVRCVNIGLGRTDIAELFGKYFPEFPAVVINDANAAALGEYWKGSGRDFKNLLFITLGTGVGGGAIIDGEVLTGAHGNGMEIGHMTVNPSETVSCNCGRKGCLEQYSSATGLVRIAAEMLKGSGRTSILRTPFEMAESTDGSAESPFSARAVFDAAKSGDGLAEDAVLEMCRYLSIGIGTAATILDPDAVIIGGGVAKAGPYLMEHLEANLDQYIFGGRQFTLRLAELGNDAGMYGAAKLAVDRLG